MKKIFYIVLAFSLLAACCVTKRPEGRWSDEKAAVWYTEKGWVSGCDFIPSYAINQLEMWQEDTFDEIAIDRELGWAEELGFNCMRVFLHHLLWEEDRDGFMERIDRYLDISSGHGISTMFVFLDDCWNESCATGVQPEPKRGVHNSGWAKDPGILYFGPAGSGCDYAEDTTAIVAVLEAYVKDVMTVFSNDSRILAWDLYNEPGGGQDPDRYWERSFPLLKDIFCWAREVNPSQPITAGVWNSRLGEMNVWQIENSDIITYHTYEPLDSHQNMIDTLKQYGRPMICTEYMARTQNSTFGSIMPMLKRENVGAISWGLVAGKTNTIFAWESTPGADEPEIWFHDILHSDGTPYSSTETAVIKSVNGKESLPIVPYPYKVSMKTGHINAYGAKVTAKGLSADEVSIVREFGDMLAEASGHRKGKSLIAFIHDRTLAEEEYGIEILEDRIEVRSASYSGTLYAIMSLMQLLPAGVYSGTYTPGEDWNIPCASIKDRPRFGYRGMLLDCSRHFFETDEIYRLLDLMSYYKLNRFHWHLTDDHGWRAEIRRYPLLTEVGAWRDGTMVGHDMSSNDGIRYGGFYTQEQLRDVVEYASRRGIEVIPEIDLPAHMVSALAAYPWLGCTGGPYSPMTVWDISKDVLCAGKDSSFMFIEGVLEEICDIFPSEYIHIGGDECPKVRWKACADCQARIRELGLEDTDEWTAEHYLQSYVMKRVQDFLATKGRKIIGWDEILEGNLSPGATVMSWRGTSGGIRAAENGFDAIMTPNGYCYLDYCQSDRPELEPIGIGHYVPVEKCYSYEPLEGIPEDKASHILGVQCNLWTEFIATPEHLEYMLLPRLLAISEVQWSSPDTKDFIRFRTDLRSHQLPLLQSLGYSYCRIIDRDR